MRCNAEFYYVGKIPRIGIGRPSLAARRGFKMVLFTASRGNTFVGGTCALPSALLVSLSDTSCAMSPSRPAAATFTLRRP